MLNLKQIQNPCTKVVRYEKHTKRKFGTEIAMLSGLQLHKGFLHANRGMNQFEQKETHVPKGYRRKRMSAEHIREVYCNPNKTRLRLNSPRYKRVQPKTKGMRKYFVHDNGGRPFLVYVGKQRVYVYKVPDNGYTLDQDYGSAKQYQLYVQLVGAYRPQRTFVGKSPKIEATEFSGGHGKGFTGNSILLRLTPHKYVFIGGSIYTFETDDPITTYYSPVGNSDVPYPVAYGRNTAYFMLDHKGLPSAAMKGLPLKERIDGYAYFYGHKGDIDWRKEANRMKRVKVVQKRLYG